MASSNLTTYISEDSDTEEDERERSDEEFDEESDEDSDEGFDEESDGEIDEEMSEDAQESDYELDYHDEIEEKLNNEQGREDDRADERENEASHSDEEAMDGEPLRKKQKLVMDRTIQDKSYVFTGSSLGWYHIQGFDHEPSETFTLRPGSHPTQYTDNYKFSSGISTKEAPLSSIKDIFRDILNKALLNGLDEALKFQDNRPFSIGTMCSGTEAPVLFLRECNEILKEEGKMHLLRYKHVFSAEIVDWKQHYILANTGNVTLFRDIVEFSKNAPGSLEATTVWGAMVKVPTCDLLVAGFCCVDFSPLNNNQKSIEDGGESGDTLVAIIDYATKCGPKMILLENVAKAPWTDKILHMTKILKTSKASKKPTISIAARFANIGYATEYIEVDTKSWYIPQTRVRGYMLCIKTSLCRSLADAQSRLRKWKALMVSQKTEASVAADAFLYKADEPLVRAAIAEKSPRVSKKEVSWTKCAYGHELYRSDLGLGQGRPITQWTRNGTPNNPDFHLPLPERTDRVSDTLDITHLRNVLRGIDDRYYSRLFDLSQNVYREKDGRKTGVIGCYTPHGIPFSTTRGGKITGREGLILQGLPVEKMELDQLSNSQMHDLAGNAMSTTVVGPAMLLAFAIFGDVIRNDDEPRVTDEQVLPQMLGDDDLETIFIDPASSVSAPLHEILSKASESARFCYCEGRHENLKSIFRKCLVCGHTACDTCGKNPKHDYIDLPAMAVRMMPAEFEAFIKDVLPMKIGFTLPNLKSCTQNFKHRYAFALGTPRIDEAANLFQGALLSEAYFTEIRRREFWEIRYYSKYMMVILSLTSNGAEWQVFVIVPSSSPGDDTLRLHFEQYPIMRMKPSGDSIIEGVWQSWSPYKHEIPGSIISEGPVLPSFKNERGLKGFADEYVHGIVKLQVDDETHFQDIIEAKAVGEFELHQNCGQPFNTLHQLTENVAKAKVFFYHEHTLQTGHPETHGFILTTDVRRLDYGERRQILAHVKWEQPKVTQNSKGITDRVTFIVDGEWRNESAFKFADSDGKAFEFQHLSSSPHFKLDCSIPLIALKSKLSIPNLKLPGPAGIWNEVGRSNAAEIFNLLGGALYHGKILDDYVLENLKTWAKWKGVNCSQNGCNNCAPKRPNLLWAYDTRVKGRKIPRQIAFEDPETAMNYEKAIKRRPSGISIFYQYIRGELNFQVAISPVSLCHRALANLKTAGPAKTSWYLVTDYTSTSKSLVDPFKLMNTENEEPTTTPKGFVNSFTLRPEQQRTLTWMLKQEAGISFTEREFIEEKSSEMGYLLMAQAAHERVVRGGILASEVGFGKTIMTIALALSCQKSDKAFPQNYTGSLIPSKATIVFVPNQLPKQWMAEAQRLMKSANVLIVETYLQLSSLTIADIQKATLIIVSFSAVQSESYLLRVATLAGMVEPVTKASPRVKAVWHESARKQMLSSMEVLKTDPSGFQDYVDEQLKIHISRARGTELPIPSKRLIGRAYQNAGKKRTYDDLKGAAHKKSVVDNIVHEKFSFRNATSRADGDFSKFLGPVFEMFHFAREVVDEFPYLIDAPIPTITNLEAESYWGLSGTPPYDTYAGVKAIATFLRVYVGPDDFFRMPKDVKDKAKKEMTSSEKILTFHGVSTPYMVWLQSEQAREFLSKFVRKDTPKTPEIKKQKHFRFIIQPVAEAIASTEYQVETLNNDFNMIAHRSSPDDFNAQIAEILEGSANSREGLQARGTRFVPHEEVLAQLDLDNEPQATDVAQHIMEFRERQYRDVEPELRRLLDIGVWFLMRLGPASDAAKNYAYVINRIKNNKYGDLDVTAHLCWLITEADSRYSVYNDQHFRNRPCMSRPLERGIPMIANDLVRAVRDFVHRRRSHRFYSHYVHIVEGQDACDLCYKRLDDASSAKDPNSTAEITTVSDGDITSIEQVPQSGLWKLRRGIPIANTQLSFESARLAIPSTERLHLEEFSLLSTCGHLLCSGCLAGGSKCPVPGCSGSTREMITANTIFGEQEVPYFAYGEKFRQVVDLINSISNDDQVLFFVPSDMLHSTAKRVLLENDILFTELKSKKSPSKELMTFQTRKDTPRKKRSKVLLLDIGDATAAGSNLANANHVIFLAPYLTLGSDAVRKFFDSMKQAEGRVDRFGQKKEVHFYYFATLRTVDCDILEKRYGFRLLEHKGDVITFEPSTQRSFNADFEEVFDYSRPSNMGGRDIGERGEFASLVGNKVFTDGTRDED